jgi:hypothetical protein
MVRSRLTRLLAAAVVAAAAVTGLPPSPANSQAPECRWASRGHDVNQWVGGPGSWSDATKWSKQQVPGLSSRDYACIPQGSDVVIDDQSPRVDLDLLELGRGARLTLRPGTALFLWADQNEVRSITKRDSVIELDGATLGGGGRLHVIGTLDAHESTTGSPAVLTTRPEDSSYSGPRGILEIGDEGLLDVHGSSSLRLSTAYIVDVHGKARLRDSAGLVADHGTTFMLQQHYFGSGVGKLVVLNDGDFAVGRTAGVQAPPTFVNRGRIAKRAQGLTTIEGMYFGDDGKVSGDAVANELRLPPPIVQGTPTTESSGTSTTAQEPQVASIQLPVTDPDVAKASIEPLDGVQVVGAIGVPMKVHATGMLANVADPAVIELRYDASLFTPGTLPADPAVLEVKHAEGPNAPYFVIPTCLGRGAMPLRAASCLDRSASRTEDGGVVMVIRTTTTSRWIIR